MDVETLESQGAVVLCHTVSSKKKITAWYHWLPLQAPYFCVFFFFVGIEDFGQAAKHH